MRETIHSIWLWHYSHSSHPCCNLQFFTILQMNKFENCPIHKVDVRENRNSNLYRRSRALHWSPKQLIVLSCTAVYCTVLHDTEKVQGRIDHCGSSSEERISNSNFTSDFLRLLHASIIDKKYQEPSILFPQFECRPTLTYLYDKRSLW